MSINVGSPQKSQTGFSCSVTKTPEECCKDEDTSDPWALNMCLALCVLCCWECKVGTISAGAHGGLPDPIEAGPRDYQTIVPSGSGFSFTRSEYGAILPIVFGSDKLDGNVFWHSGFQEQIYTQGEQRYFYTTTSFALGICEGEINNVLRIWLGERVILDRTTTVDGNNIIQPNADGFILGADVDLLAADSPLRALPADTRRTRITVFTGSEAQLPEGIMASTEGFDNSPAYRGLAYILFENFIVTETTIPAILVEVSANTTALVPRLYGDFQTPQTYFDRPEASVVTYDPGYDHYIIAAQDNSGSGIVANGKGIALFDGNTLEERAQFEIQTTNGVSNFGLVSIHTLSTGMLVLHKASGNQGIVYVYNPFSGTLDDTLGPGGGLSGHDLVTGFGALRESSFTFQAAGSGGYPTDIFCGIGILNNSIGFAEIDPSDNKLSMLSILNNVTPKDNSRAFPLDLSDEFSAQHPTFVDGLSTKGINIIVFTWANAEKTEFNVGKVVVQNDTTSIAAPTYTEIATIDLDLLGGRGFEHQIRQVVLDPIDNTLIVIIDAVGRGSRIIKWSPYTGEIIWNTPVTARKAGAVQAGLNEILTGGIFAWLDVNNDIWTIDLETGDKELVIDNLSTQLLPSQEGAQHFFNAHDNSLTYVSNVVGQKITKVFLNKAARASVAVSEIVRILLRRIGITDAEVDILDLQALSLTGYTIRSRQALRAVFSELAQVFRFDIIESNGLIVYRTRGDTSFDTVDQKYLGDVDTNGWLKETQDVDFAQIRKLNLTYRDIDRDYLDNVQSITLPKYSQQRFDQDSAIDVTTSIVLTAAEAKRLAEILMYSKIIYQQGYEGILPARALNYDPADIITFDLGEGETIVTRLRRVDIGQDKSVSFRATREDPAIYNDVANLFGNVGRFDRPTIDPIQPRIDPLLLSFPFRSDTEAALTSSDYFMFVTFLNLRSNDLPDRDVLVNINGSQNILIAPPTNYPTWGYVTVAPTTHRAFFATDYDSSLTVKLISSTGANLASATSKAALVDNSQMNLAYVGGELIQFETVTDLGDNTYRLTGLHRGRFGTDAAIPFHTTSERFVLLGGDTGVLDEGSIRRLSVPFGDSPRKSAQFFVDTNNPFQPAPIVPYLAANLRPWSVAGFKAAYSGDDAVLSWQRRTRFNGQWIDDGAFEEVDLNETTESYVLFLHKNLGTFSHQDPTTYLRRVELTTPSYTYTSANQTADGFVNTSDNLFAFVYQTGSTNGIDVGTARQFILEYKR